DRRDARDDRGARAGEPPARVLRQRRARLDRRSADDLRPRAARRPRACCRLPLGRAGRDPGSPRRGGADVPRPPRARLPARPDRGRAAGTPGAAHPSRAGGDDGAAPPGTRSRTMILLNPGPVNVSPRVTAALARGDLCHREPESGMLPAHIRRRLVEAFAPGGGFTAVLVTGSATAALEAAVGSVLS